MFYTEADKLIYTDAAGNKHDPLSLHRKLTLSSGGNLNTHLAVWSADNSSDCERAAAEEAIVAVARSAFGLKPFTEEDGVVDGIALATLNDFLEWLAGKE